MSELEEDSTGKLTHGRSSSQDSSKKGDGPVDPNISEKELNLHTWDYCLVFKVGTTDEEKQKFEAATANTVHKIKHANLKTYCYKSTQEDEVICLVGATEKRLRAEADRIDYELPLIQEKVIDAGCEIKMKLCLSAKRNGPEDRFTDPKKWFNLYGPYDSYNPEHAYRQGIYRRRDDQGERHPNTLFRTIDRQRITKIILEEDQLSDGAGINIEGQIGDKQDSLVACFPLHETEKRDALKDKWLKWVPLFSQPMEEIRDYYGEKVAFYFSFLEFYCWSLIVPALIGAAFFFWQVKSEAESENGRIDIEGFPVLSFMVAVWGTCFLEFWKRKESNMRVNWGMSNYRKKERLRPDFTFTKIVRSPINGAKLKYFPQGTILKRICISQAILISMILMVLGTVTGIMVLRGVLKGSEGAAASIPSILNAIQIQVFNMIYGRMSETLNDWENHETQTDYDNSLIAKNFMFKFVNSYTSLFYIAFFKRFDEGVDYCQYKDPDDHTDRGNCLRELQLQLAIIFFLAIAVNNGIEILTPKIKVFLARRANTTVGNETPKSQAESEYELLPYETFADYDELAVQFGYVTMFLPAFPLTPALALANNYFEIRLDATKVCEDSRRPDPEGAENIGTWYNIFEILSYLAVMVNVLIVVFFTPLVAEDWAVGSLVYQLAIFIVAEHLLLTLKIVIAYAVPDVPEDMKEHLKRQEYIVDTLIKGKQEESEEEVHKDEKLAQGTAIDVAKLATTFPAGFDTN